MSITDYFGNIKSLLVRVHDAELKAELLAQVLDAQGEALNLQDRIARLQDENSKLRKQLEEIHRASELENDLYFARDALWRKSETAFSAYCMTCWGTKRQLIPLIHMLYEEEGAGVCPGCNFMHNDVYAGKARPNPE